MAKKEKPQEEEVKSIPLNEYLGNLAKRANIDEHRAIIECFDIAYHLAKKIEELNASSESAEVTEEVKADK